METKINCGKAVRRYEENSQKPQKKPKSDLAYRKTTVPSIRCRT